MEVLICGNLVKVEIIYKNNKNLYIRPKEDGKLYVYCNKLVSLKEIEKIIKTNEKSLGNMLDKLNKNKDNNECFYYLGKRYTIIFMETDKVKFDDDCIIVNNSKELDKFYLNECVRIFNDRVLEFKKIIKDIPEFRLRIRKMKTRWGVCNTKDKIVTLNSELLKKDLDLLDYVIVHELCHFYEANHSSRFWNHVSIYYPNYKLARKRLRG